MTAAARPAAILPAAMRKPDAAAYIGHSVRSFERLVSAGTIVPRRAGDRIVIYLRADLDAFVDGLPVGGGDMPGVDDG